MPARLIVHFPDAPTRCFALAEGPPQVIGRDPACEVAIDDDRVSRRHASVHLAKDERWWLKDLGSKNGTQLNGHPAEDMELGPNAWISFGGLLAQFETLSREEAEAESQRNEKRWRASLSLQARLDPAAGLEALLQQVLRSILDTSGCRRGFILLTDADGGLELVARVGVDADDLLATRFEGSAGAVERALATGLPVAVADARLDTVLGARPSIIAHDLRTLVCLPLAVMDRMLGVAYADSREAGKPFSELDVDLLSALAAHAGLAISVAKLHQEVAGLNREIPSGETLLNQQARIDSTDAWERSLPSYRATGDWRHSLSFDRAPGVAG